MTIAVTATFTQSGGQPATGLTLADIDLYLTSRNRSTGATAVIWDGTQNPTEEVDNCGQYSRGYAGEDLETFDYFARADYTGATVLDIDYATGAVGRELLAADVNAEMVDVLATDTYAEPGQGVPAATASIAAKINYLYKTWRNRLTQTATQLSIYNDAGAVIDQKATISDDGTTYDRGELGTGP